MQVGGVGYTGDATNGRDVVDSATHNFVPDFAMGMAEAFVGGNKAWIKTATMGVNEVKPINVTGALTTGLVNSFETGGVNVDNALATNNSGTPYSILFAKSHPSDLAMGSFTGNGTTQNITVGFTPALVITINASSSVGPAIWVPEFPSGSYQLISGVAAASGGFSTFTNGFTVGSAAAVNESGVEIHWVAFAEATGIFEKVNVTGDGLDDRAVANDSSFQAKHVMVKRASFSSDYWFMWHTERAGLTTDATGKFSHDEGAETNCIQQITSTGMQLGTNANVNASAVNLYYYLFWGYGNSQGGGSGVVPLAVQSLYGMIN